MRKRIFRPAISLLAGLAASALCALGAALALRKVGALPLGDKLQSVLGQLEHALFSVHWGVFALSALLFTLFFIFVTRTGWKKRRLFAAIPLGLLLLLLMCLIALLAAKCNEVPVWRALRILLNWWKGGAMDALF